MLEKDLEKFWEFEKKKLIWFYKSIVKIYPKLTGQNLIKFGKSFKEYSESVEKRISDKINGQIDKIIVEIEKNIEYITRKREH